MSTGTLPHSLAAISIAAAIFAADLLSPLQGAIAVLYLIPILLFAGLGRSRTTLLAGLGSAALTIAAFLGTHRHDAFDSAYARFAVSLIAIGSTTILSIRNGAARADVRKLEHRYATIFHAAGFATWESDWSQVRRSIKSALPEGADVATYFAENPHLVRGIATQAIIRDANQAAATLLGFDAPQDLVFSNLANLYTEFSERTLTLIYAGLLDGAEMMEFETEFVSATGKRIDVVLRVTPLVEGEAWSRILVMAFDVTERNAARARIEQSSAELAHASRISTLGQLVATIAHEVNQPLAAIINYGNSAKRWLRRTPPELSEVATSLDQMVANGTRAAQVISRVRALARKSVPKPEAIDLRGLLDETLLIVGREARLNDVEIGLSIEPDARYAIGDRVQVQQVLMNIILNGVQAMRDTEGRARRLNISIANRGSTQVGIAVSDCGTGISGDSTARIFEPFFSTKSDGMGMGLSICQSIIEAQGGTIGAANNSDHGATIAFTLPAIDPQAV